MVADAVYFGRLVDWNWSAVGNVPGGASVTVKVTAALLVQSILVVTVSYRSTASFHVCSKICVDKQQAFFRTSLQGKSDTS